MAKSPVSHRYFILEAIKITLFSLGITGFFKIMGANDDTILIVFSMAVLSAAATFSPQKEQARHIALGSMTILMSIIVGGLTGFYAPAFAKIMTIIYACLAFLLPKTKIKLSLFIMGAVMFLIFSALPFDLKAAMHYLIDGAFVGVLYSMLTHLFDTKIHRYQKEYEIQWLTEQKIASLIALISLLMAWVISYFLAQYSHISHLYWISLTVMLVIQGCTQQNISIAIKRILINCVGAVFIVLLFNYLIPETFWPNFFMLVFFLFFIFALGFSYLYRTLFIEMFVLGFSHMLGDYQTAVAIDRVILTIIGGVLVIVNTLWLRVLLSRPSD